VRFTWWMALLYVLIPALGLALFFLIVASGR
jgi:hypothetical protein